MHSSRESLFFSSLRSFCIAFSVVLGICFSFILAGIVLMLFSGPSLLPQKSEMVISPDAKGNREMLGLSSPVILRIDIHGVIGTDKLTTAELEEILLDSRDGLLSHNRVKGILLHLDTPGGTVSDSDGIYHLLQEYKSKYHVPIYAFVDGLCASGGVYISSAADRIYATPSSVYGSVGVLLGPSFNVSEVMGKIGVSSLTLTQGKDKDMLNPFRPWKVGEEDCLRSVTAALYERFVAIVTTARPALDKTKLVQDYGAQVFISTEAKNLGYIDAGDSDYNTTLTDLVKAAGIAETESYQVVKLESPRSFVSDLIQGKDSLLKGKMIHELNLGSYFSPELSGKFLYLYHP